MPGPAKHSTFKKLLHRCTIDVLGELAFNSSFGIQTSDDVLLLRVVPRNPLGSVTSASPDMTHILWSSLPIVPHSGLQDLFKGEAECVQLAPECVERLLEEVKGEKAGWQRKDILTSLILAKHPDTGEHIAKINLDAEAFGFM